MERDCNNCKHKALEIIQQPCEDCLDAAADMQGSYTKWEAAIAPAVKPDLRAVLEGKISELLRTRQPGTSCDFACGRRTGLLEVRNALAELDKPALAPVPSEQRAEAMVFDPHGGKTCSNCRHLTNNVLDEPCFSCLRGTGTAARWESRVAAMVSDADSVEDFDEAWEGGRK